MVGLADFGIMLGDALGIGQFAGGLLASLLFIIFVCLVPCLIFTKGRSFIAEMIAGFAGLCFCVAVGWFDIWVFAVISLITAGLLAIKIKDML